MPSKPSICRCKGSAAIGIAVWIYLLTAAICVTYAYALSRNRDVGSLIGFVIILWLTFFGAFIYASLVVRWCRRRAKIISINKYGASDEWQWYLLLVAIEGIALLLLNDQQIVLIISAMSLGAFLWLLALLACCSYVARRSM